MNEINTYSISKLQKAFDLITNKRDCFYIKTGRGPLYTDEPFRTETYSILLLKKGSTKLQADLTSHIIRAPAVLTIGPIVTRSFARSDEQPEMEVMFFTDSFLLETMANVFFLHKYQFFEDNDRHLINLKESELNRLNAIFDMIAATFNGEHSNETALMRNYAHLLIHEIDAMHRARNVSVESKDGSMFIKFRNLLTKEFWRYRSVSFYANKLNVTPKYLSEVIKKQTGKTAGEWIDQAITLEAKVLLQNKDLGVSQISSKLNFSDQSVFGKFFKTQTGVSPLEYRRRVNSPM